MTYGSYVYYPMGNRGVEPSSYPKEIIDNNQFRQDKWRASHLRTFKTKNLGRKKFAENLRHRNFFR